MQYMDGNLDALCKTWTNHWTIGGQGGPVGDWWVKKSLRNFLQTTRHIVWKIILYFVLLVSAKRNNDITFISTSTPTPAGRAAAQICSKDGAWRDWFRSSSVVSPSSPKQQEGVPTPQPPSLDDIRTEKKFFNFGEMPAIVAPPRCHLFLSLSEIF